MSRWRELLPQAAIGGPPRSSLAPKMAARVYHFRSPGAAAIGAAIGVQVNLAIGGAARGIVEATGEQQWRRQHSLGAGEAYVLAICRDRVKLCQRHINSVARRGPVVPDKLVQLAESGEGLRRRIPPHAPAVDAGVTMGYVREEPQVVQVLVHAQAHK